MYFTIKRERTAPAVSKKKQGRATALNTLILLFILFLCSCSSTKKAENIPVIDTHIHLYDTSRPEGVDWPKPNSKKLYKPHLPADFLKVAKENTILGTIMVEASYRFSDNQYLLDISKSTEKHFIGLVGYIALGHPNFDQQLNELCKDPRFVGIRMRPQSAYPYFSEKFWQDLKTLEQADKTLDILVKGLSLSDVKEIVRRNPKLKIMINHMAQLRTLNSQSQIDQLVKELSQLAQSPKVYCKISGGLLNPKLPELNEAKELALKKLFTAFGEDRLVFGSNWPVLSSQDLKQWKQYLIRLSQPYGDDFVKKLFYQNALTFYGLD